jgi:hypothetical protein
MRQKKDKKKRDIPVKSHISQHKCSAWKTTGGASVKGIVHSNDKMLYSFPYLVNGLWTRTEWNPHVVFLHLATAMF